MIELGLSDLLGADHGDIEPMSRVEEPEQDEAFRSRIRGVAAGNDERAAIAIASGAELDDLGRHYGLRRLGSVPGLNGPPAA